jgi:hypothetical protein
VQENVRAERFWASGGNEWEGRVGQRKAVWPERVERGWREGSPIGCYSGG